MSAEVIDFTAARFDRMRRDVLRQIAEIRRLLEEGDRLREALREHREESAND